jgi:hypothetical protein
MVPSVISSLPFGVNFRTVVAVVGAVDATVGTDRDAVRPVRELALPPGADEVPVPIVDDDRMVAAADQEHPLFAVHGYPRDVAVRIACRKLLPTFHRLVFQCARLPHVDLLRSSPSQYAREKMAFSRAG